MGSRPGLDGCGKYFPYRDSIPVTPYRVVIPTELSQLKSSVELDYNTMNLWQRKAIVKAAEDNQVLKGKVPVSWRT